VTADARRDDFRHAFRDTLWWEVGVFAIGLALAASAPRDIPLATPALSPVRETV
jgi:hypothetical protein